MLRCKAEHFYFKHYPKRAMHKADGDLMESTTDTNHKADERCQRLDKCCELTEACEHACRKLNEERKARENMNC
jgi:hypothetical protein